MTKKVKCSTEGCERDASHKGKCSGCYAKEWRVRRNVERTVEVEPRQLTAGDDIIEGEIVHDEAPVIPKTHLIATNPVEMQATRGDVKAWLEQKLTILERDIIEANAALNEARRNGWATTAFTSARNRAVDEETFYNKILVAVEAGYTMIPDFPIQVFAVRREQPDKGESHTWTGPVSSRGIWLRNPAKPDCAPAGTGEYRNPEPLVHQWSGSTRKDSEGKEYRPFTVQRTHYPVGPMVFPSATARSPIMKATASAMKEKVFDQIGACLPVAPNAGARQVQENRGRAGDPLVIGQVLRKREGPRQKAVSFIIAWYLNLNDL